MARGANGKLNQGKSKIITLLAASILSCISQNSYADLGPSDSMIKLPGSSEIDRSLRRLREAWDALQDQAEIRKVLEENNESGLSIASRVSSAQLETTKFQHYYEGLEVVGSMAMHQVSNTGSHVLNRLARFSLNTRAQVDLESAVAIAKSLVGDRELSSKPELKILPEAEADSARLVYWVNLDGIESDGAREVIIDANSGEIIGNISKNIEIAPIYVFNAKNQGTAINREVGVDPKTGKQGIVGCLLRDLATGQTQKMTVDQCDKLAMKDLPPNRCQVVLDGTPAIVQPQFCQAQVSNSRPVATLDASAARAAQNSQKVLAYFLSRHKRNSFDNKGSPSISIVHGGLQFSNAYWNTEQNIMVYGDGSPEAGLGDFTLALDVAGHEMAHGVVAHTADLLGMGESGALNEAYADFFGKMIDNDGDWAVGRKLFLNKAQAKGVRDLARPSNLTYCAKRGPTGCLQTKPFPSHIRQKEVAVGTCDRNNDSCWVHINATIPGHASYLVVQAIGAPKAEALYYATLTQSLTSRDTIMTAAAATKKTCARILDAASCAKVNQAFAQVGL